MARDDNDNDNEFRMEDVIDRKSVCIHSVRMRTKWECISSISTDEISASVTFAHHKVVSKTRDKKPASKKVKKENDWGGYY